LIIFLNSSPIKELEILALISGYKRVKSLNISWFHKELLSKIATLALMSTSLSDF